MTNTSIRWGVAVIGMFLAQFALVALSVLTVAVYSYTIRTGEAKEFYDAFAQASGPWVSLVAGGPVFFLIARWIRGRAHAAAFGTAMAMCGITLAFETAFLVFWPGDATTRLMTLMFVLGGMVLKVSGAWLGAAGTSRVPATTV